MAEDSNLEQPTSDASTADVSHPDTTLANTYNNHDGGKEVQKNKGRKDKKKNTKKGRASLAGIQVLLLDEEEFSCQIDVIICNFYCQFKVSNLFFLFTCREIQKVKMFSIRCVIISIYSKRIISVYRSVIKRIVG